MKPQRTAPHRFEPGLGTRPAALSRPGEGSDARFRRLFDRFYPAVRRFFARKGLPPEDCLDLTQETFLGIYRGLEGYRGEARLETWIFRIATTAYLKRLRSRAAGKRAGREVAQDTVEPHEPALRSAAGQLDEVLERERHEALLRAVRELPDQMRRCLTLRVAHDMKYREIAAAMRLSIQTVKTHLFQARKKLERRLGDLAVEI